MTGDGGLARNNKTMADNRRPERDTPRTARSPQARTSHRSHSEDEYRDIEDLLGAKEQAPRTSVDLEALLAELEACCRKGVAAIEPGLGERGGEVLVLYPRESDCLAWVALAPGTRAAPHFTCEDLDGWRLQHLPSHRVAPVPRKLMLAAVPGAAEWMTGVEVRRLLTDAELALDLAESQAAGAAFGWEDEVREAWRRVRGAQKLLGDRELHAELAKINQLYMRFPEEVTDPTTSQTNLRRMRVNRYWSHVRRERHHH